MLRIDFVTLFPEMIASALDFSMMKRAKEKEIVQFETCDPRIFSTDKHKTVDDSPYGGGPGMLMKIEPIAKAMVSLELPEDAAVILTDPTGVPFEQKHAKELSQKERIVFLCGHYEGMDERVREIYATHVFSIGDYVLTGGELPALVMADAVVRLLPGVLGCGDSLTIDSHEDGLLSAPQYTRPETFEGHSVPPVLLSGNHSEVAKWKRKQALMRTKRWRPELLEKIPLDKFDQDVLSSFACENELDSQ